MAAKINSLSAHVSRARRLGQLDQFGNAAVEVLHEHVIRIIAKAIIAQGDIWRVLDDLLAPSPKLFEPDVSNVGIGQSSLQGFAIEVRQTARHGEGTNIQQGLYGVGLHNRDEFVQGAGGMTDAVEGCHNLVSPQRRRTGVAPAHFSATCVRAFATASSCSGKTVRRSISTRPSSTLAMIAGSEARKRPESSSALITSQVIASNRVGSTAEGAAPPPITHSPSRTSTNNLEDRSLFATASARVPISSFDKRIMRSAGIASCCPFT